MTEFGTLDIISTVETEKGENEWSSATEQHKQLEENNTAAKSETLNNNKKGKIQSFFKLSSKTALKVYVSLIIKIYI